MRAIDDESPRRVAVLKKLLEWGSLPESDVSRMLRHYFVVTDELRDMSEEGLITMEFSGDEYILACTPLGRMYLEEQATANDDW